MSKLDYLSASEKTEKKFPEGLELTGENVVIMRNLSADLLVISEGIDHMKRHLVYGAKNEIKAPQSEFKPRGMLLDQKQAELLHSAKGMVTEAVEFYEAVTNHILFGHNLDETNLFEEIGDSLWYQALALRILGKTFDESMATNIEKLAKRFPDKFTSEAALNRDLDSERDILEGGLKNGEIPMKVAAGTPVSELEGLQH